MRERIIEYINGKRKDNPHYLPSIVNEIGMEYYTLYSIVSGRRKGNAESLEKMWLWYEKQIKKNKKKESV